MFFYNDLIDPLLTVIIGTGIEAFERLDFEALNREDLEVFGRIGRKVRSQPGYMGTCGYDQGFSPGRIKMVGTDYLVREIGTRLVNLKVFRGWVLLDWFGGTVKVDTISRLCKGLLKKNYVELKGVIGN